MAALSQLPYLHFAVVLRPYAGRQSRLPLCRIPSTFAVGAWVLLFKITKRAVHFLRRRPVARRGTRQPWAEQGGNRPEICPRAGTLVIPQGRLRLRCYRRNSL